MKFIRFLGAHYFGKTCLRQSPVALVDLQPGLLPSVTLTLSSPASTSGVPELELQVCIATPIELLALEAQTSGTIGRYSAS